MEQVGATGGVEELGRVEVELAGEVDNLADVGDGAVFGAEAAEAEGVGHEETVDGEGVVAGQSITLATGNDGAVGEEIGVYLGGGGINADVAGGDDAERRRLVAWC